MIKPNWLMWHGNPLPAPRPRNAGKGGVYMPPKYKQQQADIRLQSRVQINERDLDVYFDNERLAFTSFIARNGGGDGDNLAKGITDALNETWYQDDRQLLEWHIFMQRGIPRSMCGVWTNVQPVRGWPVTPPHSLSPCDFCVWGGCS